MVVLTLVTEQWLVLILSIHLIIKLYKQNIFVS